MTPVFLVLLLMTAVPLNAAKNEDQSNESLDVSEIIEKANEDISEILIHGDIAPSLTKNAVPCTATGCKWPKSGRYVYVPVFISSAYTPSERDIIIKGLVSFHSSTCIRFVWWKPENRDYLYFMSKTGCWSHLGRQNGGQIVSLQKGGCVYHKTVQHEILHALGFHHEQVRSDRDQYVQILNENIQEGKEHNFRKEQTNNLETSYDFTSVMHYSRNAFSKNGQPTIVAKSNANLIFGYASEMSANDIARVNKLYGCW
ncbi:high choriolytic enzyme 1-like [Oreochromis niloticus]|uniref:Metalloendopeptidase n=2 Tax=Oreochromis TaxID=8139 RepID=I3JIR0_ORENI|nr:high choriolytic enzyme 1-like [Oreochromis niloticus]XP_031582714.2 high choriolytic enzyme 1-like [Oreochromis aureus]CAI5672214.1 unnamed protein product [Mustela putorius furo]